MVKRLTSCFLVLAIVLGLSACYPTSDKPQTRKEICDGIKRQRLYLQNDLNTEAKWRTHSQREALEERYQEYCFDKPQDDTQPEA